MNDPLIALDLPATPRRVRVVARAAGLTDAAVTRGVALAVETPSPSEWRTFLSRALAMLGAVLALAGVVCFVAYNWDRIGRFGKFALLELAIIGAVVLAWRKLPKLSGEIALFAAAVLIGPLFALYGQTYQTGADPYGLFLTWMLVILPWLAASHFSATWLLALVLLETSITLYWMQVVNPRAARVGLYLPIILGAIDLAALVVWRWQWERAERAWLRELWLQSVLAAMGLFTLLIPALALVFGGREAGTPGVLGFIALAGAIAAMWRFYGERRDRYMLTIAGIAGMVWITALVGRIVIRELDLEVYGALIMAGFVIWQITVALKWYRGMRDAS